MTEIKTEAGYRFDLARRVSAVLDELNSLTLASGELDTLEGRAARDKLGAAWSAAYDARTLFERTPLL